MRESLACEKNLQGETKMAEGLYSLELAFESVTRYMESTRRKTSCVNVAQTPQGMP